MRALTILLCALAACGTPGDTGFIKAPHVPEPVAGTSLDRCLTRVRMTQPWDPLDGSQMMSTGTESGIHPDYRINGGEQIPVDNYAFVEAEVSDYTMFAPLIFGATLQPGANHLEVGSCDAVDSCKWTPVDLSVTLGPGSPDPAFAGSGQLVTAGVAPHRMLLRPDGGVIFSTEANAHYIATIALTALRPNGQLDLGFGARGVTVLQTLGNGTPSGSGQSGDPFIAVSSTGGYGVVVRGLLLNYGKMYFARLDAHGVLDTTIGVMGLVEVKTPGGPFFDVQAFGSDGAGHFLAAGLGGDAANAGAPAPLLLQLAADGTVMASTALAPGDTKHAPRAAALDALGRAAFIDTDHVYRGSIAGPDASFGTAGVATIPAQLGPVAIALTPDGVAVAAVASGAAGSDVNLIDVGAMGDVKIVDTHWQGMMPGASPLIAAAADGTIYIAGLLPHPADLALSFTTDTTPGSDIVVARVRGGALDTTFGDAGFAHASLMLSWPQPAIDTLNDAPVALAIGADGEAWVLAASQSADTTPMINNTQRGPGAGLVRFMK